MSATPVVTVTPPPTSLSPPNNTEAPTLSPFVRRASLLFTDAPKDVSPVFHPQKNWVMSCVDSNSTVQVLNYKTKDIKITFSLQQIEENIMQKGTPEQKAALQGKLAGPVTCMAFFDALTRAWKGFFEPPQHVKQPYASDGNFLVIAYENRFVLFDYILFQVSVKEVLTTAIGCIEIFSEIPLIALGGADGSLRVWDCTKRKMSVLTGGHKNSIEKMFAYMREGQPFVVSGGSDGTLCFWNINAGKVEKAIPKVHDCVISMTYHPFQKVLVTSGSDRNLIVWDLFSMTEMNKVSVGKVAVQIVEYFVHPCFPPNSLLVCNKESSDVEVIEFGCKNRWPLFSLNDLRSAPKKDTKGKIFSLTLNPTRPQLLLLSSNKGVFLLVLKEQRTPPFTCTKVKTSETQSEVMLYVRKQSSLYASMPGKQSTPPEKVYEFQNARSLVTATPSGKFIIVESPDQSSYETFNIESSVVGWQALPDGAGLCQGSVAVSSSSDRFALVDVQIPVEPEAKKKDKKAKPPAPVISFKIKRLDDNLCTTHFHLPTLPHPIEQLFGGTLLGVVFAEGGDIQPSIQFYKWDGISDTLKVGKPFPKPDYLYWSSSKLVLMYWDYFAVYTLDIARGTFDMIFTYNIRLTSVLCFESYLIGAGTDSISCFFFKGYNRPIEIAVTHCNLQLSEETRIRTANSRPIGSVSLIGVIAEVLFVLDCAMHLQQYPLTNPVLKAMMLISSQSPQPALEWANKAHSSFHTSLAEFFIAHGYKQEILSLNGLPDILKLKFCTKNSLFKEAEGFLGSCTTAAAAGQIPKEDVVQCALFLSEKAATISTEHARSITYLKRVLKLDPLKVSWVLTYLAIEQGCVKGLSQLLLENGGPHAAAALCEAASAASPDKAGDILKQELLKAPDMSAVAWLLRDDKGFLQKWNENINQGMYADTVTPVRMVVPEK